MVSLRLLQLAFSERKCLSSGKILYEVCSAHRITPLFSLLTSNSETLTLLVMFKSQLIYYIYLLFLIYIRPFLTCCLSGSGVLWGTLQSGVKWPSIPSQGPGPQHPPAELPDHREVPTPSWQRRQHERRLARFPWNYLWKIFISMEQLLSISNHIWICCALTLTALW